MIGSIQKSASLQLSSNILIRLDSNQYNSKMKFSIATALTVLAGVASARIDYFTVPSTIKPGDKFEVTLEGHNYIQSMYEIAAAFGITGSVYSQYSDSLQIYLDSVYLGPGPFLYYPLTCRYWL